MTLLLLCAWGWLAAACNIQRPGIGSDDYETPKFTHAAFQQECATCHEKDRPAQNADGTAPHGGGKDCVACHKSSDTQSGWAAGVPFTHPPPVTTCLPCHKVDRPVSPPHPTAPADCVSCHRFPSFTPPITGG